MRTQFALVAGAARPRRAGGTEPALLARCQIELVLYHRPRTEPYAPCAGHEGLLGSVPYASTNMTQNPAFPHRPQGRLGSVPHAQVITTQNPNLLARLVRLEGVLCVRVTSQIARAGFCTTNPQTRWGSVPPHLIQKCMSLGSDSAAQFKMFMTWYRTARYSHARPACDTEPQRPCGSEQGSQGSVRLTIGP